MIHISFLYPSYILLIILTSDLYISLHHILLLLRPQPQPTTPSFRPKWQAPQLQIQIRQAWGDVHVRVMRAIARVERDPFSARDGTILDAQHVVLEKQQRRRPHLRHGNLGVLTPWSGKNWDSGRYDHWIDRSRDNLQEIISISDVPVPWCLRCWETTSSNWVMTLRHIRYTQQISTVFMYV